MVFNLVLPLNPACLTAPSTCSTLESGIGSTEGKDHGRRLEQFIGNSNEIQKLTITETILMTEDTRKGTIHRNLLTTDSTGWLRPPRLFAWTKTPSSLLIDPQQRHKMS